MNSRKNNSESVRARLLNIARRDARPFNELLQYFAMERFLYRLSKSSHAERFILKGALMLRAWKSSQLRSTMDIDMLGRASNDEASIVKQIQEIMVVEVDLDGLIFEPGSVKTERITEDADYKGIRVRFHGFLGTARVNMQVDIGFGDLIYPEAEMNSIPALLDYAAPNLLCYSRESSIAEKFEAMVKLGSLNSRMKDFYDIWLLSRQFDFVGLRLAEAIRQTFENRKTLIAGKIDAFGADFMESKQIQWLAFHKRLRQDHVPVPFSEIVLAVKQFLLPVADAVFLKGQVPVAWVAPGPWQ